MNLIRKISVILNVLAIISFISCETKRVEEFNYLPYYHQINEADYQVYKKLYSKADSLYELSFSLVKRPFYEDCYKAAKNALNISNEKSSTYLLKGIENGLRLDRIKEDTVFRVFRNTNEWNSIQEEYENMRFRYESTINIPLRQKLDSMISMDQAVRINPDSLDLTMQEVDQLNKEKLISIILKYGYPGFSIVGEEVGRGFTIMFHHFSLEDNKLYFNELLYREMLKGEISPTRMAAYQDYNRIGNGLNTLYGGHFQRLDGQKISNPIEDFPNVNKRRYKMGLEPLEQYLEMNGIVCYQN